MRFIAHQQNTATTDTRPMSTAFLVTSWLTFRVNHSVNRTHFTMCIKKKEASIIVDYQCFFSVGVTGFEPATTRPPDAYSNRAELHPAAQLRCKRHASEQVKACFYFQRAQLSFAIAVQRYCFFFTTQTFSYFFSSFSTKIANFVEKCNRDRCT